MKLPRKLKKRKKKVLKMMYEASAQALDYKVPTQEEFDKILELITDGKAKKPTKG